MGFLFKLFASTLAVASAVNSAELLNFENERDVIPGAYIVVMKDGLSSSNFRTHLSSVPQGNEGKRGIQGSDGLQFSFDIEGWRGYSGRFDNETLSNIANHPDVKFVEPDRMAKASILKFQKAAPSWGLPRISHRFRGFRNYIYHRSSGKGVVAYVVDTGIDIHHPEFEGRAEYGINVVDEVEGDENGHGTHVSGTIAGKTFGVAKGVKLIAVKALGKNSRGPDSGIIAAMDWAVKHAKEKRTIGKAIMNLSLTGDTSTALNEAAERAVEAGFFLGVAAGNNNRDAINESPASVKSVCTVGASTINDEKASFSNFGARLDIYAPGANITSALPNGRHGAMSGTSMATPHVCGVAALLISSEGIRAKHACDRIKQLATRRAIKNPGEKTTSRLLYNGSF
ncbi:conserved hypothetical protein [Uncinocarpus reesii 1704]|uniref:Subtilisin-like protease n=1 Tax=Uncinocarpus reesii (strain UAMH 1704) TaxID=336963 RepID=C4JR55_UNCRE|nr:uncharacterized protein UREG_03537 [Uncinocarpus reesii 1704]EEP78691.1 conserved hypothetical protein [Uncinocarpus reesii 1704]